MNEAIVDKHWLNMVLNTSPGRWGKTTPKEIWLAKLVTTGVVMPGIALVRDKLPTESEAVLGLVAPRRAIL